MGIAALKAADMLSLSNTERDYTRMRGARKRIWRKNPSLQCGDLCFRLTCTNRCILLETEPLYYPIFLNFSDLFYSKPQAITPYIQIRPPDCKEGFTGVNSVFYNSLGSYTPVSVIIFEM